MLHVEKKSLEFFFWKSCTSQHFLKEFTLRGFVFICEFAFYAFFVFFASHFSCVHVVPPPCSERHSNLPETVDDIECRKINTNHLLWKKKVKKMPKRAQPRQFFAVWKSHWKSLMTIRNESECHSKVLQESISLHKLQTNLSCTIQVKHCLLLHVSFGNIECFSGFDGRTASGLVFFWIHDWGDPSLPAKSKDSHCVWGESLCLNLMAVVEDPLRPWILILHVTKMVIQGSVQGSLAKVVVMGNSFWWSAPCCGEARLYGNPQPCQWWVRGLSHHHPAG